MSAIPEQEKLYVRATFTLPLRITVPANLHNRWNWLKAVFTTKPYICQTFDNVRFGGIDPIEASISNFEDP